DLVDGLGARRICDRLGLPEIYLRAAIADDAGVTWEWANDPATRAASFSPREIPWEEHRRWFHNRIQSPDPCWIATTSSGYNIALIRMDAESGQESAFTISLILAPAVRGKGLAALLISRACETIRAQYGPSTIRAWI